MLFLLEININSIAKAYRLQRAAITCTVFEEILNLLNITVMKKWPYKTYRLLWGAVIMSPLDDSLNYAVSLRGGNITLHEWEMQLHENMS